MNHDPKAKSNKYSHYIYTFPLFLFLLLCAFVSNATPIHRLACIGDSITYGSGIEEREHNSYPAQLGRMLGEQWDVRNFGLGGRTLLRKGDHPYWKEEALQQAYAFQPTEVVIALGTNDTKPQNWVFKAEFQQDLKDLAQSFLDLESHPRLWLAFPPPAFPGRWGIRERKIRKELIPIIRSTAQELDVPLINFYDAMIHQEALFPDTVHPNAEGAACMARTVYAALREGVIFPGKRSDWHGYTRYDFSCDGRPCCVVTPAQPRDGHPWIWRARFFGHEAQTDLALLSRGFHLAYIDVADLYGSPKAVGHWEKFYTLLTTRYGFAKKVALEGMSRGGLIVFNWAIQHPESVACIYADAPVCDFKSWPGGKGQGQGSKEDWQKCLKAYDLSETEALAYTGNPIDRLAPLAEKKVPLLHVCGTADKVVPIAENTALLEERYIALGGPIEVIHKKDVGHHPHSLQDPFPIVDFILKHTLGENPNAIHRSALDNARIRFTQQKQGRVAFLGGSITEMKGWRNLMCRYLEKRFPDTTFEFINAGIASTDSTLGAFRLAHDVLAKGPIDLLFVEYAVNDQHNSRANTDRIRGMEGILRHVRRDAPYTDIVVQYCVDPVKMELFHSGQPSPVIVSHEQVCQHYGVSVLNLAREVTDRIDRGEFTWKEFGGLHPAPFGHEIYAQIQQQFLESAWKKPLPEGVKQRAHRFPVTQLDQYSYTNGTFLSPQKAQLETGWAHIPTWRPKDHAGTRKQFIKIPMLIAEISGAVLTLPFQGTAIGLLEVAGPDVGMLEYSIDGSPFQSLDQFTQWSPQLHIPWTYMLSTELENTEHTLTLRTKTQKNKQSKGNATRLVQFLVNAP